jgi:Acyl-CoA dehydrogenase, C-terminal domain
MDLELSSDQLQIEDAVRALFNRHAGLDRANQLGDKLDLDVLHALDDAGYLDVLHDAGPVEAVLVVERAGEALANAPVASRVLAGPLAGVKDLPLVVGLVNGRSGGLCRYGTECEAFLVLDGDRALLATADDVEVQPVATSFGAEYGRVNVRGGEDLGEDAGARLRRAWQVAIAVDAEANMRPAIAKTARYVSDRHQFGRPIGSFQAVQHRLATAYAMAEGTRWLGLRAAWFAHDDFLTSSAAAYACEAAQTTFTNTHQVSGAIGITSEHGLVRWTLRLLALSRELGGQRAHTRRVAGARRRMDRSSLPSPAPLPR